MADHSSVIPTEYKGYRFRSRTEARWAVFLDSAGEPWEYEKQGYDLPTRKYLPDFWLQDMNCWLEIKGEKPTAEERQLCEELGWATSRAVVIAWGLPDEAGKRIDVFCGEVSDGGATCGQWFREIRIHCGDVPIPWSRDKLGRLCLNAGEDRSDREWTAPNNLIPFPGMKIAEHIQSPLAQKDFNRARGARFEHGESGPSGRDKFEMVMEKNNRNQEKLLADRAKFGGQA